MRTRTGILVAVCLIANVSSMMAQSDRFELGQRLRDFERAWDSVGDDDGRKRAADPLTEVMGAFFSLRFNSAARLLDEARHLLRSSDPADGKVRWAESLVVQPKSRLLDANVREVEITLRAFYNVNERIPAAARLQARIADGKWSEWQITQLPATFQLPLAKLEGSVSVDNDLQARILVDEVPLASRSLTLSRIEKLDDRLDAIDPGREPLASSNTIEAQTIASTYHTLRDLADQRVKETNIPAARLLGEADQARKALMNKKSYYGADRPGDFWLTVPLGKTTAPIRIFVPEKLDLKKPATVLVALHGAGGSENLFFEGYGDGITLKTCRERGWILIGTRARGAFGAGGAPQVPELLDALAKIYPIDAKQVFLVGHSMGVGHALSHAIKQPDRYAGIALLGGGRSARDLGKLTSLPVFVGCGTRDFALRGARSLEKGLKDAKVRTLAFHEYPNVEHIMIVREAMPDVFKFFDEQKKAD